MSKIKSNVHPGRYKVAGRGRQGVDIIHDRQTAALAENQALQEHQAPYPQHASAFDDEPLPETDQERAQRDEADRKSLSARSRENRHKSVRALPKQQLATKKTLKREPPPASRGLARKTGSNRRQRTLAAR